MTAGRRASPLPNEGRRREVPGGAAMQLLWIRGRRRSAGKPLCAPGPVLRVGGALVAPRATNVSLPAGLISQTAAAGDEKATAVAVAKAQAFLELLDAGQRGKVLFEF